MNKNNHSKLIIMIIICLLLLINGCAQNQAIDESTPVSTTSQIKSSSKITVIDGLNREITLEKPAGRIISLAPSNTEILFAIKAGSQVVGRDSFSDYPENAKEIPDVGGGYGEFDIEKIVALKPDLVIVTPIYPTEVVTKLEGLNITAFYLSNPIDLEMMYENILILAQLSGRTKEAELLVQDLKKRVSNISIKMQNIEERPVVFYEIDGTDPSAPWTSGKGTFIDTLLNLAGGKNLGSVLENEWAQISIEEIIAQDPEIILIGDAVWGGVTVDAVKSRAGWDALTAIKNNRIYEFDDNIVSRPGPRLIDGLESLAKLIHPEIFP